MSVFSLSHTELLEAFITLIQTNYAASFILTFLAITFALYVVYNQTRHAIADAVNKETRKVFAVASLIILILGTLVTGGVVEGIRRASLPAPLITAPKVVVGQTGVLEWKLPAKMAKGTTTSITFLVESSLDPGHHKPYKRFRTDDLTFPLFAWENKTLYWRVRALRSAILENDKDKIPTGKWSETIKVEQYANVFQRIMSTGELRIATSRTYGQGYFSFYHGNRRRGVDPALACHIQKTLAQQFGRPIRIRFSYREWTQIFESVQHGEADLALSSITILPEREKTYNSRFSDSYHKTGFTLNYRAEKKISGTAREAVAGRRVGVGAETSSEKCLNVLNAQIGQTVKIEVYIDSNAAYRDMMKPNGRIDLYLTDMPFAKGWKMKNKDAVELKQLRKEDFDPGTDNSCWQQDYGVLVNEREDKLLALINHTIKALDSKGDLNKIETLSRKQYWQVFNLSLADFDKLRSTETRTGSFCDIFLAEINNAIATTAPDQ